MAKPRLTKSILADLTERYKQARGNAAREAILDEYGDYSVPKALAPKPAPAKAPAKVKALAKALAKPRPKRKPFKGRNPKNWSEVLRVSGLEKTNDHRGDSYGQRGAPGTRKRRAHNSRRTKRAAKNVSKQGRSRTARKRNAPKRR